MMPDQESCMYCPKCGQENADTAARCSQCQEPLPGVAAYGAGDPSTAATQTASIGNNLVWAILATLFCCLPTGIVAIVYAAQVDSKVSAGDIAGAKDSARNAATWSWVSFGLGLVFGLGYLALVVLGAVVGHH
jgi:hypothetical protein